MAGTAALPVRRSREQRLVRAFRRAPLVPTAIMMVMATMAAGADVLAPHSPVEIRMDLALRPPSFMDGGQPGYFLGTDPLGRDILSRLMHGARASLLVACLSIGCATIVGQS
jgi:ABC-type dipeptide/oligopeptide/nickel transport system permease subunit